MSFGKKAIWCWTCKKVTPHKYVGRDTMMDGMGPFRILMAVCSLGISEMALRTHWQCERCGDIYDKP